MLAVGFGLARGDLHFVGLELGLGQADGILAFLCTGILAGLNFLLVLGQLIDGGFVLALDVFNDLLGCRDFLRCGMAVQHAEEQLVDHLLVVRHVGDELGDGVILGADGIAHGRATDERHDRAKLKLVRALTLAGALAGGAAEVAEEAVGQLHAGVRQLRGSGALRHAGEFALGTGDTVYCVKQYLGR